MMQRVTGGAVNDGVVGEVLAVVDQNGPEVDKDEENHICDLGEREQEREDVVRDGLAPTVDRVEGVACKWGRHDPLVVGLVQPLVDERVMKSPMNPVDPEVSEGDEEGKLSPVVPLARTVFRSVVESAVPAHFEKEQRSSQKGHAWH